MADSTLDVIVTDAGIQEMINAEATGTDKVTLSTIKLGNDIFTPTTATTDIGNVVQTITAVGGTQVSDHVIHVTGADNSSEAYKVYSFGVYTDKGTLFAVASSSSPILEKVELSQALLAVDIFISNGNPSVIEFGDTNFTNPPASQTSAGVVRLATDTEAAAAADSTIALTPTNIKAIQAEGAILKGLAVEADASTIYSTTTIASGAEKNVTDKVLQSVFDKAGLLPASSGAESIGTRVSKIESSYISSATAASTYANQSLTNINSTANSNIFSIVTNFGSTEQIVAVHNNIYRGANLLNGHFASIDALCSAVKNGNFSDIYIGDYISASFSYGGSTYTTNFRVAGINWMQYSGSSSMLSANHLVIVPDATITAAMNSTNTTEGGYIGSNMYTTVIPALYAAIGGNSGTPFYGHIISHQERFSNTISTTPISSGQPATTGCVTNAAWVDNTMCLMSEQEVYGAPIWSSSGHDNEMPPHQLPMFRLRPETACAFNRYTHWLRSVYSQWGFCVASGDGVAGRGDASFVLGLRPRFLID